MAGRPSRPLALAAFAALAACSSSAPKDFALTPQSPRGILAFGLAPAAPNLTLYVARVDPATCRVVSGSRQYERTPFPFHPNRRGFVVDDLPPGFYVFTSILEHGGFIRFSNVLEGDTRAFEIRAGRINYIGDLRLTSYRPESLGYDEAALREHLRSYPRIAGEPVRVELLRTAYALKSEGPRVEGCALGR